MPIYDYDEIPNLFYYINSGIAESYTKTGDVVDTINSLADSGGVMTPNTDPSPGVVTHGVQSLSAMPAFYSPAGSDAAFVDNDTFASGILGPLTLVIAFQVEDPNVTTAIVNSVNTNSNSNYFGLRSNSGNDNLYTLVSGGTVNAAPDGLLTSPMIAVVTWDNGPEGTGGTQAVNLYLNGGEKIFVYNKDGNAVHGFRKPVLLGSQTTLDAGMGGTVAIAAWYNTFVNDAQAADLYTLTKHWIDNNEPPVETPVPEGTSTKFGPVTINDPTNATLQWQWRATDQDAWANVALSDFTVETGPGDNPALAEGETQLLINSAQLSDAGQISCLATTAYNTQGQRTHTQHLDVVEPS